MIRTPRCSLTKNGRVILLRWILLLPYILSDSTKTPPHPPRTHPPRTHPPHTSTPHASPAHSPLPSGRTDHQNQTIHTHTHTHTHTLPCSTNTPPLVPSNLCLPPPHKHCRSINKQTSLHPLATLSSFLRVLVRRVFVSIPTQHSCLWPLETKRRTGVSPGEAAHHCSAQGRRASVANIIGNLSEMPPEEVLTGAVRHDETWRDQQGTEPSREPNRRRSVRLSVCLEPTAASQRSCSHNIVVNTEAPPGKTPRAKSAQELTATRPVWPSKIKLRTIISDTTRLLLKNCSCRSRLNSLFYNTVLKYTLEILVL